MQNDSESVGIDEFSPIRLRLRTGVRRDLRETKWLE